MSRAEASLASGSGFDEELSRFLSAAHGESFVELLRKKCAIGKTISESFTCSDADAFTFAQSLSYRKPWQIAVDEFEVKMRRNGDRQSASLYCIFHQQLCKDWQVRECLLDRSFRIFEILPHRKTLLHLSDPKTACLVLLSFCFGLDNVIFVGLHNVPHSSCLPGPYLGLLHPGSRESFLDATCHLEKLHRDKSPSAGNDAEDDRLECNGRLAEISYLASEFDDLFAYVLCEPECYSAFTEPLLRRMYTNRLYGRLALSVFMRGYRERYREQPLVSILKRFNDLLRIVCRILNDVYHNRGGRGASDNRNFGTMAVITLIYSYLYAILSIPVRLTPWNKTEKGEACTCKSVVRSDDVDSGAQVHVAGSSHSSNAASPTAANDASAGLPSHHNVGLIGADFASAAADAACVESTRRKDVIMSHAIGLLGDDVTWLRRSERYVDVIDNYKLSLCWYRRPMYSNCLHTNFKVLCPWAIMYHQACVGPCASAWLEWQGKSIESWSSLPLWRNAAPADSKTAKTGGDCLRCLKRLVCLRVRDCVSFIFDLETDIKRTIRRHYGA
ncbi:methionyl-tRNA formyltransferase, putative [Babesia ovata]|uniref:Methionyl-tRNA formyltransferase, putative n=1 Tax=Babesia ovata TaxID=189622 RepID=A0A2H6KEZ5_9APIC|nr:methionyl-tRNA formyltransferase, putative [Babesia ovata]GBE61544.1 methionyl-tRNA formyltransferase, putative [Babesia ovata]